MRALYERTRPRDLYDVVYLLENRPETFDFDHIGELFREKCATKQLMIPSATDLFRIVEDAVELETEWGSMLAHQLPELPLLESLLLRLPVLIRWIDDATAVPPEMALTAAPVPAGASLISSAGIQYWGRGVPLEVIRFAGTNRLLVEFDYDDKHRLVEPYSLRQASTGNILLYGWEQGATHIKAFNLSKILDVHATPNTFQPRYRIEFTPEGSLHVPPTVTPAPRVSRRESRRQNIQRRKPTKSGLTYIFECPNCQRRFRRSQNSPVPSQPAAARPPPQQIPTTPCYPILSGMSRPRYAAPRLAASHCGWLPPRAGGAAGAAREHWPLARGTRMLQGCFQGCASEGPAIKWRLFHLSVARERGCKRSKDRMVMMSVSHTRPHTTLAGVGGEDMKTGTPSLRGLKSRLKSSPQPFPTGRSEAFDPGKPLTLYRNPS